MWLLIQTAHPAEVWVTPDIMRRHYKTVILIPVSGESWQELSLWYQWESQTECSQTTCTRQNMYSNSKAHNRPRNNVTSLVPRPYPKYRKRGLGTLANIPVCAESAYYVAITWSHGSQLLLTIAIQSWWTDLVMDQLQANLRRQE